MKTLVYVCDKRRAEIRVPFRPIHDTDRQLTLPKPMDCSKAQDGCGRTCKATYFRLKAVEELSGQDEVIL